MLTKRLFSLLLLPIYLLANIGTYVGELQEKWEFPSDHMPIGITFEGVHYASWNVLDAMYMDWVIEKNSQGLSRSQIADEHVFIGDTKLTLRDQHVIDLILQAISHPTHPKSIFSLQESGGPFLKELRSRLPSYFNLTSSHGETVLFDTRSFELVEAKSVYGIFADNPERAIQEILLKHNGEQIRLLNIHLPGDPKKPGRFEFAAYLHRTFDPSLTTLVMGDMNFNEEEMADAMEKAFENNSPFSLHSPYPTNISPYVFNSKAIDHFFVYSPKGSTVTLSTPEEIMPEASAIVDLLLGKEEAQAVDF